LIVFETQDKAIVCKSDAFYLSAKL